MESRKAGSALRFLEDQWGIIQLQFSGGLCKYQRRRTTVNLLGARACAAEQTCRLKWANWLCGSRHGANDPQRSARETSRTLHIVKKTGWIMYNNFRGLLLPSPCTAPSQAFSVNAFSVTYPRRTAGRKKKNSLGPRDQKRVTRAEKWGSFEQLRYQTSSPGLSPKKLWGRDCWDKIYATSARDASHP